MAYENSNMGGAYTAEYYDQYNNTINNGEARIPICICVDTSRSMHFLLNPPEQLIYKNESGMVDGQQVNYVEVKPGFKEITKLSRLQEVLCNMFTNMKLDDVISKSAVICIVTFNQFADCFVEFTDISKINTYSPNDIRLGKDMTNVSKGIKMSLERLDQQAAMNSNAGNDSYKPVLILMSDGEPTDSIEAEKAREQVRQRSDEGKINVIPISIGAGVRGENWLKSLSCKSRVYRMNCLKDFEDVFSEIKERMHMIASVVSTDEDEQDISVNIPKDVDNSIYGKDTSDDILNDFLNS